MPFPSNLGKINLGECNLGDVTSAANPIPVFFLHYARLRSACIVLILCGISLFRELFPAH